MFKKQTHASKIEELKGSKLAIEQKIEKYSSLIFNNQEIKIRSEKEISFYAPILEVAEKNLKYKQGRVHIDHEAVLQLHQHIHEYRKIIRSNQSLIHKLTKKNHSLQNSIKKLALKKDNLQQNIESYQNLANNLYKTSHQSTWKQSNLFELFKIYKKSKEK